MARKTQRVQLSADQCYALMEVKRSASLHVRPHDAGWAPLSDIFRDRNTFRGADAKPWEILSTELKRMEDVGLIKRSFSPYGDTLGLPWSVSRALGTLTAAYARLNKAVAKAVAVARHTCESDLASALTD